MYSNASAGCLPWLTPTVRQHPTVSWNLFIYKPGADEGEQAPLGTVESISDVLNAAFPGLQWDSATECTLPVDQAFSISLTAEEGMVSDLYTSGGYYHLRPLAAFCKRQGWRIADAQEGEGIDLDNPYAAYGGDAPP